TVASVEKPAEQATSSATPNDPNMSDGFYWMFSSLTGTHDFAAARRNYATATASLDVASDAVTRAPLTLKAGKITIAPATAGLTVPWQGTASQAVTVTNTGTAPATVTLGEQVGGSTPMAMHGPPTMRIKGTYSPLFLGAGSTSGTTAAVPNSSLPAAGPWTP